MSPILANNRKQILAALESLSIEKPTHGTHFGFEAILSETNVILVHVTLTWVDQEYGSGNFGRISG